MKGIPVRLAMGKRDLENGTIEIARRDTKEKESVEIEKVADRVIALMDEIQSNLYNRALKFRSENTHEANSWEEFKDIIENKGGFVMAHWDGSAETEDKIKEETKATIRNIPFDSQMEEGKCIFSGNPSKQKVLFAKAY